MHKAPLLLLLLKSLTLSAAAKELRIESVATGPVSFAPSDKSLIFHDEFDAPPNKNPAYFEVTSEDESFVQDKDAGLDGAAMRATFEKGQVTVGTLKLLFGRNPFRNRGVRPEETFREIYWRVYVKHEPGWEGNPAKLARATCLIAPNWTQGFIAHVWGGKDDLLCIDPATGIQENRPVTTKYNDFGKLKWLGLRNGQTPIFSEEESGRWICVESHIKLNTPGKADGVFELWLDGKLEASRADLNWHGIWEEYAINAVFLENYWNDGSVKRQSRWFDNLVVSTSPIGPITATQPLKLRRTHKEKPIPWEAEIASDPEGREIVWRSKAIPAETVEVVVPEIKKPGIYWVRVRTAGQTEWSSWHCPFKVATAL